VSGRVGWAACAAAALAWPLAVACEYPSTRTAREARYLDGLREMTPTLSNPYATSAPQRERQRPGMHCLRRSKDRLAQRGCNRAKGVLGAYVSRVLSSSRSLRPAAPDLHRASGESSDFRRVPCRTSGRYVEGRRRNVRDRLWPTAVVPARTAIDPKRANCGAPKRSFTVPRRPLALGGCWGQTRVGGAE